MHGILYHALGREWVNFIGNSWAKLYCQPHSMTVFLQDDKPNKALGLLITTGSDTTAFVDLLHFPIPQRFQGKSAGSKSFAANASEGGRGPTRDLHEGPAAGGAEEHGHRHRAATAGGLQGLQAILSELI